MHSAKRQLRDVLQAWRKQAAAESLTLALAIDPAELDSPDDAAALGAIFSACGELTPARESFKHAWQMAPERFDLMQSYAGALTAAGQFAEAEDILNKAARQRPEDAHIWYALAFNRKQTEENNPIDKIKSLLKAGSVHERDQVFLHYALGKCLEDTSNYDGAFTHFEAGARLRRGHMRYDVGPDVKGMAKLREIFTKETLSQNLASDIADCRPIFVLGLPRSGTTLIERIISAHLDVGSIGEATTFTHALGTLIEQSSGGQRLAREQAIEHSLQLDPNALGRAYIEGIEPRSHGHVRIVDKMPLNFLYIGLIRKALPHAKIILVRRGALDNCWAMFSTLFRQAYPFTYNFDELSDYYAGFDALMSHWTTICGPDILSVNYEDVTENLEGEARRIIDYLDLDWQEDCLSFHKNSAPTATASAAQVRSPIYKSSVGRWQRFGSHLDPLKDALESRGITL